MITANTCVVPEDDVETHMRLIVSPFDVVMAVPRDADDHIDWLLRQQHFKKAMLAAKTYEKELERHTLWGVSQRYLTHLLERREYARFVAICPSLFDKNEDRWAAWIAKLITMRLVHLVVPVIPLEDPTLSEDTYKSVLENLLNHHSDQGVLFLETVRRWPSHLYHLEDIIDAVRESLKKVSFAPIVDALGELYAMSGRYAEAVGVLLKVRRHNAFSLIQQHNLVAQISPNLARLLSLDVERTASLVLRYSHELDVDELVTSLMRQVPCDDVVVLPASKVKTDLDPRMGTLRVNDRGDLTLCMPRADFDRRLWHLLRAVFRSAEAKLPAHLGDLTVHLCGRCAEDDPVSGMSKQDQLKQLLRALHSYRLDAALQMCQDRSLTSCVVFLLGRMGNTLDALKLMVTDLGDVAQAVAFITE
ncbi:MAG: hypothetical protein MHM6MM_008887, partial [Cercozoa sp. M6MM]